MAKKRVSLLGRATLLEGRIIDSILVRIKHAGLSQREVERRLHWGRGTLNNLLSGQRSLTFGHIELLGDIVGFTPHDVLLEILGVPYGLKMRPENDPGLPGFQNLQAIILEVERQTATELGEIRTAAKTLEDSSIQSVTRFVGLFYDIMSRYSELMHLLNDLVAKYSQQQKESTLPTH